MDGFRFYAYPSSYSCDRVSICRTRYASKHLLCVLFFEPQPSPNVCVSPKSITRSFYHPNMPVTIDLSTSTFNIIIFIVFIYFQSTPPFRDMLPQKRCQKSYFPGWRKYPVVTLAVWIRDHRREHSAVRLFRVRTLLHASGCWATRTTPTRALPVFSRPTLPRSCPPHRSPRAHRAPCSFGRLTEPPTPPCDCSCAGPGV